jgi:hypothetical protein
MYFFEEHKRSVTVIRTVRFTTFEIFYRECVENNLPEVLNFVSHFLGA